MGVVIGKNILCTLLNFWGRLFYYFLRGKNPVAVTKNLIYELDTSCKKQISQNLFEF